ncbi:hypothetical protein QUW02_05460 [Bacteroides eggerthii]|uniref:Lipoprotein n=1 Tax=Bacteroides eggerthii TaxID=28111 RepID=A0ABT7U4D3_9BACE|nr:hypothetical protein [Bacteroides eggerthii]
MKRMILFLGLGSLLTLSCTKRYTTIIGGADQPTAIFIADPLTLQGKGLELTCQMHRLANNETYIKYCSHSDEINKLAAHIGRTDYSVPKKIFAISHLKSIQNFETDSTIRTLLADKMVRTIPSLINAQSGSTTLAATTLFVTEDVFLHNSLKESTIYLYVYEGDCSSMVLFQPHKDHIVQAHACFVIHSLLKTIQSADDVKRFFKETIQLEGIMVQELTTTSKS